MTPFRAESVSVRFCAKCRHWRCGTSIAPPGKHRIGKVWNSFVLGRIVPHGQKVCSSFAPGEHRVGKKCATHSPPGNYRAKKVCDSLASGRIRVLKMLANRSLPGKCCMGKRLAARVLPPEQARVVRMLRVVCSPEKDRTGKLCSTRLVRGANYGMGNAVQLVRLPGKIVVVTMARIILFRASTEC